MFYRLAILWLAEQYVDIYGAANSADSDQVLPVSLYYMI